MKRVETVFVLLTYRNADDLSDFLASTKRNVKNYAVIVVNSFYDENTKMKIQEIAKGSDCDFINCENKGYGYGNNRGIEFANIHYKYEYLVVANPDIVIEKYSTEVLNKINQGIIAPRIINKAGKMQNPMVWKKNALANYLVYKGLQKKNKLSFYIGLLFNKLCRGLFFLVTPSSREYAKIYQGHGSCIIFPHYVLGKLGLPFDENIFLFAEEGDLAEVARKKGIPFYYTPQVRIYHKEDGSMQFRDDLNQQLVEANIYVYEKHQWKDKQ